MNRAILLLLMLLVVLSPLPLGANREWSWTLCALLTSILSLAWLAARGWRPEERRPFVHPAIPILFLLVCAWVVFQSVGWAPGAWKHPLWEQAAGVIGVELTGTITLSADDSMESLMRLVSYALLFYLAYQLGAERSRARAVFGWLVSAGLAYALFGLFVLWTDYAPEWLFGEKAALADLRSTFVNRNHFATWQGLTLLCAVALLYQRLNRGGERPYEMSRDRETRFEAFFLQAWKPLTVILLMTTALVLTHSRGGFLAALGGTLVLLALLDSRSVRRQMSTRMVAVSALAVCSLAFYLTSEVLLDRLERTEITTNERLIVYENVRHGVGENPLLGFGYGTFADSFRLYDRIETPVHYDRAHNTWLENLFELGVPAALALFLAIGGLALTCYRGVRRRHRDWVYPATGVAASVLVGFHALLDFSLQIPAVAILYACIMGVACAQSRSSLAPAR